MTVANLPSWTPFSPGPPQSWDEFTLLCSSSVSTTFPSQGFVDCLDSSCENKQAYLLGLLYYGDVLHYVPSTIWHNHRGHHSFLPKQKHRGSGWRRRSIANISELKDFWVWFGNVSDMQVWSVCERVCAEGGVMWKPHGLPLSSWLGPSNVVELWVKHTSSQSSLKSSTSSPL